MIEGRINAKFEAFVDLNLLLNGKRKPERFLVDTGFNGFVAVPQSLVNRLRLPLLDVQEGVTADGRLSYFDTVKVTVLWHDRELTVQAQILDEALIGTRLLRGSRLCADWVVDGEFHVEPII
jgi:clan AA aspartic protease